MVITTLSKRVKFIVCELINLSMQNNKWSSLEADIAHEAIQG